ncbi:MAG: hypothetical protein J0H63_01730 [Rhizobiales bacterium]|nr:hypothetical protein [Hyphomicrobiales bacterium]MBN9008889.1 hypothetical protein [Hyphomicrobiales bacterium]
MTPFHLTYTPGPAEFAAALATRPTSRLAGIAFVASIVFLGAVVGILGETSPAVAALLAWSPPFGEIAVVGLIVLAWSGIVIWLGRRLRDFRAGRMARDARPTFVTMDDGGILVADAPGPADPEKNPVQPWAKVFAVTMYETHVAIAFADRPPLAIPLAAFASRAEAAVFALAAEERLAREEAEAAGVIAGVAS